MLSSSIFEGRELINIGDDFLESRQVGLKDFQGLVFKKIIKDYIGKGGSDNFWGEVYQYNNGSDTLQFCRKALYKSANYDCVPAPYNEKLWSVYGKIMIDNCRVPDIEIVKDKKTGEDGLLSYIILDNDKEDLIHMKSILFNKYTRQEIEEHKKGRIVDNILTCVKMQVKDNENYEQVERAIIDTCISDCITNNIDRNENNWGLIRNKQTDYYDLFLVDHSASFINMSYEQKGTTTDGWTESYIMGKKRDDLEGQTGYNLLSYINQNYETYFTDFMEKFYHRIGEFYNEIGLDIKSPFQRRRDIPISLFRLYCDIGAKINFIKHTLQVGKEH